MKTIEDIITEMRAEAGIEGERLEEGMASEMHLGHFLLVGEEAFLKEAAKLIRKIAGQYAEKVRVKNGRTVVWLEYVGQDGSDIDLDLMMHLIVKGHDEAVIHVNGNSAARGRFSRDMKKPMGQVTPLLAAEIFRNYFGR